MLKRWLAFALVLSACGSDSAGGVSGGGTGSGTGGLSGADMNCEPGTSEACYCTDGKKSGTQACSTKGVLQQCVCPPVKMAAVVPDAAPGALCPDLANQSNCEATPYLSEQLPASMLFVLDRSRSMVCNLPPLQSSADCESDPTPADSSKPTKWNITREALSAAFGALPNGILVGLNYFSDNGACGVDSLPAVEMEDLDDTQRGAMTDSLNQTVPDGETPIVGATILAYAHLHQEVHAPGNRFVVLITDGAESCAPNAIPQLLDTEVKKARDANIRTFVIGAPGSEGARALLSELAFRGGTAGSGNCKHDIKGDPTVGNCHLDMTTSDDFASALTAALGTVSTAAQGCEFAVPSSGKVDSADQVNVQYTPGKGGSPICYANDPRDCDSVSNGWQFAVGSDGKPDFTKVVLCGTACDAIRKDPSAKVDILLGCSSIPFL
ncbi:MAG: uncharacterized protein JWN48_2424 [Myxococcaceae bacterium]|nr:uncharacterized protein [Myxococcaceae bacterium]